MLGDIAGSLCRFTMQSQDLLDPIVRMTAAVLCNFRIGLTLQISAASWLMLKFHRTVGRQTLLLLLTRSPLRRCRHRRKELARTPGAALETCRFAGGSVPSRPVTQHQFQQNGWCGVYGTRIDQIDWSFEAV
jgi:hypothetical protein